MVNFSQTTFFVGLLATAHALPSALKPAKRQLNAIDAFDHSWIEKYTSLGDSYSVGLGAGHPIKASANVELNPACEQYSYGYPNLLNSNGMLGENADRKFQFLGCSGAITTDVIAKQIPLMKPAQLVTVSTGGNDALLADILNWCVYQWKINPFYNCKKQMRDARKTINDPQYVQNFRDMLALIKTKLVDENSRIYWTGYERFFDDTTNDCDGVTWSFFYHPFTRQYLKKTKRIALNELADLVNTRIRSVCDNDPQCVFVDSNDYTNRIGGHFCEPGVNEKYSHIHGGAARNREETTFYEWGTDKDNDNKEESATDYPQRKRAIDLGDDASLNPEDTTPAIDAEEEPEFVPNPATGTGVGAAPPWEFDNSTFEGRIAYYLLEGMKSQELEGNLTTELLASNGIIPDKYKRVFHRNKNSNGIVARNVLMAMNQQQAGIMQTQAIPTPIVLCANNGGPGNGGGVGPVVPPGSLPPTTVTSLVSSSVSVATSSATVPESSVLTTPAAEPSPVPQPTPTPSPSSSTSSRPTPTRPCVPPGRPGVPPGRPRCPPNAS